jgi:di/tricarboxylate transporter
LIARAGSADTFFMVLLMVAVAALGAFMSSTGVVAIFVAVALRIARSSGGCAGRLRIVRDARILTREHNGRRRR